MIERLRLLRKSFLFSEEKGKLKNVIAGDTVWNPVSGLGMVKRIEDTNRVIVTNPGISHKDDKAKNNKKGITQGYLVKL